MKASPITVSLLFALAIFATVFPATAQQHDHAAFKPKHGWITVEFPGHKFALEIVEAVKPGEKEGEKIELVRTFLTDAHYEPVAADVKEVKLFFTVNGKTKQYALPRLKEEPKKDAKPDVPQYITFESVDAELVKLVCEGWKGNAVASMTVGKTPYKANLVKVAKDDKGDAHKGHKH